IVQSDRAQGVGGMRRFLVKKSDAAVKPKLKRIVFFDLLKVLDVINGDDRRLLFAAEFAKIRKLFVEQVIAADDDEVVIDVLGFQNEMDITDRAELVTIIGRAIVHDREIQFRLSSSVNL